MISVHLFLVGLEGSGKSSLGKRLAANLSLPYLETDERVGEILGMLPGDVRRTLGEAIFHNAETGVLIELIDQPPAVVCTGAGMPMVKENVQLMQNHGIIIHIDRPLDQLMADARGDGSQVRDPEDVRHNYNAHIGFYRACADRTFVNDHNLVASAQELTAMVEGMFPSSPFPG